MKSLPLPAKRVHRAVWFLLLIAAISAFACGPDFPNWLLGGGEAAMITAPTAMFRQELDRLHLPKAVHEARPTKQDYADETLATELADLDQAMEKAQASTADRTRRREALRQARVSGIIDASANLPPEFVDYVQGAWHWRQGQRDHARARWTELLARPAEERHYKSTWAAYMLGRSAETNEWEQAIQRYQQVRSLAAQGFADPLGLSAASYGWEAQAHLRQRDYARAIGLYLQQLAAGDNSAVVSLRECSRRALNEAKPAQLQELARQEDSRRVIGAWLISGAEDIWAPETQTLDSKQLATRWLTAVEQAGIRDLATGEQMALAAYQAGDMNVARRWIQRAALSPTVQWLNAKLWLRSGKVDKAAEILSRVVGHFPLDNPSPEDSRGSATLQTSLWNEQEAIPAGRQFQAELGVLRLVRREYVQALDALLRADFWMDAAYVAERVLTLPELQSYVDRSWPEVPPENRSTSSKNKSEPEPETEVDSPDVVRDDAAKREAQLRAQIRHLLARRLVRNQRAEDAAPYLPESERDPLARLIDGMQTGSDETKTAQERADGWWQAAVITREHGLELLGTELEPDWAVHGGSFETGVTLESRLAAPVYARASSNEITRAIQHGVSLNKRFHYRYTAAAMGWQAAQLLPNNEDQTARILCTSGGWIKVADPQAADVFYKSLVRRCRKTSIGKQADEMRWFPTLDAAGHPLPHHRVPRTDPEPDTSPQPEPAVDSEDSPSIEPDQPPQAIPAGTSAGASDPASSSGS